MYQFKIINSKTNVPVFQSRKYSSVEVMEAASVDVSTLYDDTHYCIQYTVGASIDMNLTKWIYKQKLKSTDKTMQKITDEMRPHEDRANAEVFVC